MTKRTVSVEVQCSACGSTVFEVPDEHTNDPLAKCSKCGAVLGPMSSIYAKVRGEGHTPVNVKIVVLPEVIDRENDPVH
jgi:uncharacterized Zn finger protein